MGRPRIPAAVGQQAIRLATDDAGSNATGNSSQTLATATRYLLQLLAELAPGNTVEVRVPPYGAVQCGDGPTHTRGTPPNVIETDAATWLSIATGALTWEAALAGGSIMASGSRASLAGLLPLDWQTPAS